MEKPLPIELLEKYIKGDCTQAELALIKQWYTSFEQAPNGISDLNIAEEQALADHMYANILNDIYATAYTTATVTKSNNHKWYSWAAAAAVIIAIGTTALVYNNKLKPLQLTAKLHQQQFITITNNSGQIYKSTLPDNTLVWLNPHAQLSFPKIFAAKARLVSMKGECFFEVSKNAQRPFIISSRSMITKVWGTSFLVRDNELNNQADVSVLTGKVSVGIKGKNTPSSEIQEGEVMLHPHEKVTYLANLHVLRAETRKAEPALQIWNRVNLSFDNKPLSEIIPVLNSTFHVHIRAVNRKLNHYILNADLEGFNLPDVLEALKKSLNVNYQIKKDTIELV